MPRCWGTQHWKWAAEEGSCTPLSWHWCPQCARDLGLAGSLSWQPASPCPEAPAQPLQAGPRLGPLHPLPGPDKAPWPQVPILWQQGQMAGTKLTPALQSSAVLWPGRTLGKSCRPLGKSCGARMLPTTKQHVLPKDTTQHGSGWK